jgi:predicted Rossmann fold flavoprotein
MKNSCDHHDVIVLGAGAAGLLCALTAARRGRRVLVLERANKVGKKILMSGGGRCNFTNLYIEPRNYLSANPHFCKSALSRYTQWDFIAMVERHGIAYEERKHGQLFCTHSAKEILAMLLDECSIAGVTVRTHCEITAVEAAGTKIDEDREVMPASPSAYQVKLNLPDGPLTYDCASLVVATGALSIPTLGGSGLGYEIARQFSLHLIERQAGLVPFMFTDSTRTLCERLSGVSLHAEVSCNNETFAESILFTHRGLSGPAILQISNYWRPGDLLSINLLPEIDVVEFLLSAKRTQGKGLLKGLLNKQLPRALLGELGALWWPDMAAEPLAAFSDKQLMAIGAQLNRWQLKPSATEGYRTAEVTLGGVDTNSISSKTMEAKQHAGLYFIGEVVDVTGHLGGFNFQWAWSSGYTAGLYA